MEDTTPTQNEIQHNVVSNASRGFIGSFGAIHYADNFIHPTAIIEAGAVIGRGNYFGAFCYITKDATIGNNNRFEAFCSIATEPEHREYFGKPNKGVIIGNNNTFREYVTVNSGCEKTTILEDDIIMLKASHIGHDSTIKSNCTFAVNVVIAGHCLVGRYVTMGLGSVCHQYSRIGSGSMIGMNTVITKKVNPKCFGLYVGAPPRCLKENTHLKSKFTEEKIKELVDEFETLEL
jgi:UDP-N-acetylglucosamine acyltransferase